MPTAVKSNPFAKPSPSVGWWIWGGGLLVLASGLLLFGSTIRDVDQASLINGAWELANGKQSPFSSNAYNYDKHYIAYWYLAIWLKLLPGVDPVRLGNFASLLLFGGGAIWALRRFKVGTVSQVILVSAILVSPVVLLHAPFLSSHFVSCGFLLAGTALWRWNSRWRQALAILLLMAAVGARADALCALPIAAWVLVSRRSFWRFVTMPHVLLIGGGGLIVTIIGRMIVQEAATGFYPSPWMLKTSLAFTLFGMGGALLGLVWLLVSLLTAATRQRFRFFFFYSLAAGAILAAFLFYQWQLFSPLHFLLPLMMMLLVLISRRGRVLPRLGVPRSVQPVALALVAAVSLIPLVVGVHLPFPDKPRLVLGAGTSFPTADGHHPFGGLIPFLWNQFQHRGIRDHNQAVWLVSRETSFKVNEKGETPFFNTQMFSYYQLAANLQGGKAVLTTGSEPWFYIDSRSSLRFKAAGESSLNAYMDQSSVSPEVSGISMLLCSQGKLNTRDELEKVSKALSGNSFQKVESLDALNERAFEGSALVFVAKQPFSVELERPDGGKRNDSSTSKGSVHLLKISARDRYRAKLKPSLRRDEITLFAGILPEYMDLGAYPAK